MNCFSGIIYKIRYWFAKRSLNKEQNYYQYYASDSQNTSKSKYPY